ncbi:MAG TPA: electron transfer flavoprotein subunit alpha/FixB family protein [Solirubrobacteraceae bacterium]|nr:electron transfer flavoprotein subunit alpha/FixB family protein [Solirubrobacteraceae bacterium]
MGNDIFVLVEHTQGAVDAGTHELLGKARELAAQSGGRAVACLLHSGARAAADGLAADAVLAVEHPALEHFLPEAYVKAMAALLAEHEPRATLIANTTVGMDVAGGLSARAGVPLVAYCTAIDLDGDELVATSQVFGGKLNAEVAVDGAAICSVVAGSFAPAEGGSPDVQDVAATGLDDLTTSFIARIVPEVSDVDITAEEILVSVGRGIAGEDNIELAQELADALGGVVSASRPVTDGGWLPKARQVGKSGQKVKPKLYIAVGISGAPEHLEGMAEAELIIAINTDENAPIFDVAHYGTTEDLFDVLPALTEQIEAAVSA